MSFQTRKTFIHLRNSDPPLTAMQLTRSRPKKVVRTLLKQSMWHQWFNLNFMKLQEYFLCAKKTKIMTSTISSLPCQTLLWYLALGFHQKYLNLCSEWRSYGFEMVCGWEIIFGSTIPLNCRITILNKIFTNVAIRHTDNMLMIIVKRKKWSGRMMAHMINCCELSLTRWLIKKMLL